MSLGLDPLRKVTNNAISYFDGIDKFFCSCRQLMIEVNSIQVKQLLVL